MLMDVFKMSLIVWYEFPESPYLIEGSPTQVVGLSL